ncbi:unnamed protein product [Rotaria sordida]|uniref:Uncharacterized protein n=1 Tax=Rotaria sordida TaxID=392033 RepID=A0A818Q605_9BILA|nr:unnamed protein product [Rotaria sordida]CAF3635584.1 unnamed protein product [Rotaria sordida]CAF3714642.1 unnamed protein product [Rotaria sordida]CAF3813166.1 unnamed protein product [Rotaria sordida]
MLYPTIIFFVIIAPITTQSVTIEIEGLAPLLTSLLDRFIEVIDPTLDKFQNVTTEILSVLENRITCYCILYIRSHSSEPFGYHIS